VSVAVIIAVGVNSDCRREVLGTEISTSEAEPFMRKVLAHVGKSGGRLVSAFVATAFAQEAPEAASAQWRAVADQIRPVRAELYLPFEWLFSGCCQTMPNDRMGVGCRSAACRQAIPTTRQSAHGPKPAIRASKPLPGLEK